MHTERFDEAGTYGASRMLKKSQIFSTEALLQAMGHCGRQRKIATSNEALRMMRRKYCINLSNSRNYSQESRLV